MESQPARQFPAARGHAWPLLALICGLALSCAPVLGQPADSVVVPLGLDPRLKVDILLVVAHPDDESAFAGYLARAVLDEGRTAAVVYLADGIGGESVSGTEHGEALGAVRQMEARAALTRLGVSHVWFLGGRGVPSMNVLKSLASLDHGAFVERLIGLVRLTRPEVVLTWIPAALGDGGDHQASGVLATEAFGLAGDPAVYPTQLAAAGAWDLGGGEYGGLRPWQPKRLYFVTDGGGLDSGLDLAEAGPAYALTDVSPSRGVSYAALAATSAAEHRTQEGFLGLSEALDRGGDLSEALRAFEAYYGFPFFPDPTRFVLGASRVGGAPRGDLFAGITPGPIPFAPAERGAASPTGTVRLEVGGPLGFYSSFWSAHGLGHLAGLGTPTVWMRRDEPVLRVPLLLVNATPQRQVIRVTATLPEGWEAEGGVGSYEVSPHTTVPVEGRVRPQAGAEAVPGAITWEGRVGNALVSVVPVQVAFSPGLPQ